MSVLTATLESSDLCSCFLFQFHRLPSRAPLHTLSLSFFHICSLSFYCHICIWPSVFTFPSEVARLERCGVGHDFNVPSVVPGFPDSLSFSSLVTVHICLSLILPATYSIILPISTLTYYVLLSWSRFHNVLPSFCHFFFFLAPSCMNLHSSLSDIISSYHLSALFPVSSLILSSCNSTLPFPDSLQTFTLRTPFIITLFINRQQHSFPYVTSKHSFTYSLYLPCCSLRFLS
jgi:hypothetical protein